MCFRVSMFVQSDCASGAFLSRARATFSEEMSLLSKFLGLFKKNDGFSLELVALKVQMLIVDCHSQVIRNRRFGSTTCVAQSPDRNAP